MNEEKTQIADGVASELNAELGITTKPTETGLWLCSCDENDGEWCPVIIHTGKNGELMVTEKTIGSTYPLDAYHSNLINGKWKKAKVRHRLTTDA